jgi:Zn-finger nucleic acid-binding protein
MEGPYRSAGAPSGMCCPRCTTGATLWRRTIAYVAVDECRDCEGVWVRRATLEAIIEDLGLYQEVRAAFRAGPPDHGEPRARFYLKCPACTGVMNKRLFAPGAKVIVDVCQGHGTWFDACELPAVVSFVEQGGLDAARREEQARKTEAQVRATLITADYHAVGKSRSWLELFGRILGWRL